jgi:hypothetical protein
VTAGAPVVDTGPQDQTIFYGEKQRGKRSMLPVPMEKTSGQKEMNWTVKDVERWQGG